MITKSLSMLGKINPNKRQTKEFGRVSFMYEIAGSEKYFETVPYLANSFYDKNYPILSDDFLTINEFDVNFNLRYQLI